MKAAVAEREARGPFSGAPQVLNCPPAAPFLPALAASILKGAIWNAGAPEPHDLPALTIYLPSRAAVEPLKLDFLWLSPNEATFLPRIRVLGEADPLDLFAAYGTRMASAGAALDLLEQALAIPPAFEELERRIHLSAHVLKAAQALRSTEIEPGERLFAEVRAASAAAIASEIAALIDEAHSDAADFSRIDRLDAALSSGHEQLALQLLRAVRKSREAHKARSGRLDPQERRNRLMAIEAEFIRQSGAPVIVAGSTGSVAATMALMEMLAARQNSAIVLQGLDRDLDAASWAALQDHPEHPQHGLHQLLARLGATRDGVRDLAAIAAGDGRMKRRAAFLGEALRPASTTAQWAGFVKSLKTADSAAPGLSLIEAEAIHEEAAAIALVLRDALETKGATAALVTPDEKLIARVRHALTRWGLTKPTRQARADVLASRAVSAAANGKAEDLVALMRLAEGADAAAIRRHAEIVDLGVLRQMWRPSSMAGVGQALARAEHAIAAGEARHPAMKRIASPEWEAARLFADRVLEALDPLASKTDARLPFEEWTAAHLAALDRLADLGFSTESADEEERSTLEAAASVSNPALTFALADYAQFFAELCAGAKDYAEDPHPRLTLRTPLDFRLLSADVIVLGGLNEGSWPRAPGPSPWLDRRARDFIGLSPEERRIGQSAQDFAALASAAPKVVLTRSRRVDGALTRPSRWIARMTALASGAGLLRTLEPETPWLSWARSQRAPAKTAPAQRPAPAPPIEARPRRLSVTAIETWLANPYAIYARHILGLEPLSPMGKGQTSRDKGVLYHAALHRFVQAYPARLPANAAEELARCLDRAADELGFNLENGPLWRPRFARFAEWFASTEGARRAGVRLLKSEVGGKLRLEAPAGPFEIVARADRIDVAEDGSLRIYDFKTSASAAKTSASRDAPQLALEGMLAMAGAFAGVPEGRAAELIYIVATGGQPPGDAVQPKKPSGEAIEEARAAIIERIARFDDPETPYAYEARAVFRDKADHDPYAHLARLKEWAADEGQGEDGDD
ncbi:MAG: double-strand break repair protein AddB [Rhodomicrobium sp.]